MASEDAAAAAQDLIEYGRDLLGVVEEREQSALAGRVVVPPLRSALFVPGNRGDWIRKSAGYGADAIVIDLEDSVQPADRDAARVVASEEIGPLSERVTSVWVRVNSVEEELLADLEAAVVPGLAAVQLAKVYAPASVLALDRALDGFEKRSGIEPGTIAIVPVLESAGGIREAFQIAMCSRRVEYMGGLVAPEGDTARALRMRAMSDAVGTESLYLRSKVLLDARAAGVRNPLSGVVTDLRPESPLLETFARSNRDLGYAGMLVIHPSHVATVNDVFSPSADEIVHARRVLEMLRASDGRGAVRGPDEGTMIDLAMGRFAVLLLEQAVAFGLDVTHDSTVAENSR